MDTETHENVFFWNQTIMLITKIDFVLKSEQNWDILLRYANFRYFGSPFWILNDLWFFYKNYTAATRTKNKIFRKFDKNPIIITPDFAVRIRLSIFPGMTSSVVYLEILTFQFKPKVEFFKPEVDTPTHKKMYFWNQTIMLIIKIYFVL